MIKELFSSGHWMIAFLITLFSIVTPLVKVFLTFLASIAQSLNFKNKVVDLLHAIGKWSMADVFVAGILAFLMRREQR